jgi:DNA ligase (NAD+)
VAAHLHAFFEEPHNQQVLAALLAAGVEAQAPQLSNEDQPLGGQIWVLTGTLAMPRTRAKTLLESLGARVTGSVSANTTVLLAGEAAGSKLRKAESLGVEVMDEASFQQLLASHGLDTSS